MRKDASTNARRLRCRLLHESRCTVLFSTRCSRFRGRNIFDLYDIGVRSFFEKHLESFIGDRLLDKPDVSVLERLYADEPEAVRPSAHVLHLKAAEAE